ncbi:hypothetical protein GOP47_0007509 [Adiantum capillus-veneris]|uniref:Uncharacterized protein n=1 Tax=Adiantum capillus-veneris TaxID=13818 RepID=A0A9D4V0V0_ADICA|nr:hypothetical protein GOP47_0007509 [Adiantum capillus-veneris]
MRLAASRSDGRPLEFGINFAPILYGNCIQEFSSFPAGFKKIASPFMALRPVGAEEANYWMAFPMSSSTLMDSVSSLKQKGGDTLASTKDAPVKVRKPYTITKQRERWTEDEHQKFLDALKSHGRAWRRIEEHIGTKTAVQIRSHAQKFFSKLEREASLGGSLATAGSGEIEIPPPRPKRKPNHPYPKKALGALSNSPSFEEDSKSPPAVYSAFTPLENSSGSTKSNFLPKKAGASPISLRLFGQTMVQGVDKVEADNELMESTGSPRSQVSVGTEETSGIAPVVGNTAADQSALVSKLNEPISLETKSQLFNALSEWEKNVLSAYAPHFIGGHHLAHSIPAFWQGFAPPSFGHGANDDTNAAAAIATATYAVASAWQAIQGALISNASNDSNASIVYSPTAILAASGKPIAVSMPLYPPQDQPKREQGSRYDERGNDSEGSLLQNEESTAECCSSLTDSSRLSSYESNDERIPAKKRQRRSFGDSKPLHSKPADALHSMECERALKLDTISSYSEDPDNLQRSTANSAINSRSTEGCMNVSSESNNARKSLFDELMQLVEDKQQTSVPDMEEPLNLIIEACGLNLPTETEKDSCKTRAVLKKSHDSDKEMCSETDKSCTSNECLEGLSNPELKDVNGLQSSVNGTHTESGEHLFMFKAGASSSRYSGVGFVPYKKSTTNDSLDKHED